MKLIIHVFLLSLVIVFRTNAQEQISEISSDTVKVIDDFKNLYRYHNLYIGGQPTLEALKWFKNHNVAKIINIRAESEREEYREYAYNEANVARELGFEYQTVPVDSFDDFSTKKLNEIFELINTDQNILIHCLSAGRSKYVLMAYLIKIKEYSIQEALKTAESMDVSFSLERLEKTEICLEKHE